MATDCCRYCELRLEALLRLETVKLAELTKALTAELERRKEHVLRFGIHKRTSRPLKNEAEVSPEQIAAWNKAHRIEES